MPLIPVTIVQSGGAGSYVFLSESIVGAGGVASVDFSGIPSTYRHLVLQVAAKTENAASQLLLARFNNDSAGNYDYERLLAAGSGPPTCAGTTGATGAGIGVLAATGAAQPATYTVWIPYYANTTYRKEGHSHGFYFDAGNINTDLFGFLWESTAAINRITLVVNGGSDIEQNSMFSLYGIT